MTKEVTYGLIPPDVWKTEAAIEIFRKMIAGEYPAPPISRQLGFILAGIDNGRAVFEGTTRTEQYNPMGTVHGGYIATLLDSAMACSVQSTLEAGKGSTSVELKVNFVRPVFAGTGPLQAIGEVVNVGRQIGSAEGRLIDADGKLYAHGTTTCFIFDL